MQTGEKIPDNAHWRDAIPNTQEMQLSEHWVLLHIACKPLHISLHAASDLDFRRVRCIMQLTPFTHFAEMYFYALWDVMLTLTGHKMYQELDSQGNLIYAFLHCLKTQLVTMHILADGYSIGGCLMVTLGQLAESIGARLAPELVRTWYNTWCNRVFAHSSAALLSSTTSLTISLYSIQCIQYSCCCSPASSRTPSILPSHPLLSFFFASHPTLSCHLSNGSHLFTNSAAAMYLFPNHLPHMSRFHSPQEPKAKPLTGPYISTSKQRVTCTENLNCFFHCTGTFTWQQVLEC